MVAAGGGGGVVVGVVGERDDDLFKATRGPHGTSSAGASFLHLFSARLLTEAQSGQPPYVTPGFL